MHWTRVSIPLWFNSNKHDIDIEGLERALVSIPLWFNSNVPIREDDYICCCECLNSTLVQFKQKYREIDIKELIGSQFHFGSIQTNLYILYILNIFFFRLNSTLVQFKRKFKEEKYFKNFK